MSIIMSLASVVAFTESQSQRHIYHNINKLSNIVVFHVDDTIFTKITKKNP